MRFKRCSLNSQCFVGAIVIRIAVIMRIIIKMERAGCIIPP